MIMIARRLVVSLALAALVSNGSLLAKPSAGSASTPDGQAFTLVSLKHQSVGALTRVLIESNSPPLYTVLRPTDRLVVIELPGGDASQLASQYAVKSALVDSIVVRKMTSIKSPAGRATSRLEIAVSEDAQDRSVLQGNTLIIEFSSEQPTAKTAAQRPGVYVQPVPVSLSTPATTDLAKAQPSQLKPATLIRNVRTEPADSGLRVFVEADGTLQFKEFMLPDPWRLVVDIAGVRTAFGNKNLSVSTAGIDRVRVGQPEANVVRIVLDAKSKISYRVAREGAQLVISIGAAASEQARASDPVKRGDSLTDSDEQVIPGNLIAQTGRPTAAAQSSKKKTDTTSSAKKKENSPAQPATRERVTSAKPSAQPSNAAKETITHKSPEAPASSGRSVADLQRSAAQPTYQGPNIAPAAPSQAVRESRGAAFCDPDYVGGLISFDLRAGVDLRDMLRFISQQYGINFIMDKSVGSVPIDIRVNDRPWNEVLNAVLRANRLGALCENNGGIIRIAALIAVKEQREQERWANEARLLVIPTETKIIRLRYARVGGALGGTGTGRSGASHVAGTTGYNSGGMGSTGANKYGVQGGGLLQIITRRLSPRGVIEIDQRTNSLIITDIPEYIQAAEAIVAQLDRPDPQVEIEARIVIASRNFLRDLGVELGAAAINSRRGTAGLLQTSPLKFSPGGLAPGGKSTSASGGSSEDTTSKDQIGPNLIGPFADTALRASVPSTVLSLTTGLLGTTILSTALSAAETKAQIRTIASPRITASNNQTAEIVNGVQIPVQTVSNNTVTTTFITAALRLEITPQIIEETGEVLMHVVAENNSVDFTLANQFNNGTPGINTQSADSTVRVGDGGTTVMGGINIDTEGHTMNRTPGVSKIPLVGELFKRRTTRRDYAEILFFITPRIVKSDGWGGPRSLAPQRSSVEGTPNPQGTQKAAAPVNFSDPNVPKATQPVQAKAGQ
jgi:type IV pilus assembly protein PilQ